MDSRSSYDRTAEETAVKTAMIEDVLANAYNNWPEKPTKTIVYPQATLQSRSWSSLEQAGYTVISLDCIAPAELKRAMEWYEKNTDWSAFERKDWQAAMESLS